jgi:hypothetical protein
MTKPRIAGSWLPWEKWGTRTGSNHQRKRLLPVEIVIGLADSGVKDYATCVIPQGDARERTLRSTSIFA